LDEIPLKRRLATVLAADAVGYSRLMSEDEEGTLRVLAGHREVIDAIIASREGRIFGTAGDSVLAEFASPVEAVRCAIEIQSALRTRNAKLPEHRRMLFRIGINLGDVTIKDGDLLGDGVNVAARLEGISDPGGVCVSSSVYEQTLGKLTLGFSDLGEQALKNITRPVRAYSVFEGEPALYRPAAGTKHRPVARNLAVAALVAIALVVGASWWFLHVPAPDPELAVWEAVRNSTNEAELKAYLEQFPGGAHAQVARTRLAGLQAENDQQRELQAALRKAQADAELARAEAARQKAAAQQARLEEELRRTRAEAERARSAMEADRQRLDELEKQRQAAQQPSASPAPPARVANAAPAQRHDGAWVLAFECQPFRTYPTFEGRVAATISNGIVTVEHGAPDDPEHIKGQGSVDANDGVVIRGERYSPKLEKNVPVVIRGRFEGEQMTGTGSFARRPCAFTMIRAAN